MLAIALILAADVIRIGVLNDQSGLYAYLGGAGSVAAARMAVEDFGGKVGDTPIEVISGDHHNKPDVGSTLARQWLDVENVDVIADVPTSSVALAVSQIVREKNRVFLASGAGTSDLTGKACSPNTVQWTYDSYAVANVGARAAVEAGGKTWFFLTADYAFGQALERDATHAVEARGGKVLGAVRHPLGTADFSAFLMQAKASGAQIIGLANAGGDAVNAIKGAHEFGIDKGGQKLAALLLFAGDVHALGLEAAQGLTMTESFYWDKDDATRAFSKRFFDKMGTMPNSGQAGVYASVLHYLKAVKSLGSHSDGAAVVARMKQLPTDDALFGKGTIRADGRKLHPMYLYAVKAPGESKGEWDLLRQVRVVPGEEAFRPLQEGGCEMVRGR